MNLYFLVEGRRTEKRVYPKWLAHLVPGLKQVDSFDAVEHDNYFLFSGEGYPSLLRHLRNAIDDYQKCGRYDRLVVALDVDEVTPEERREEIRNVAEECGLPEHSLTVLTQHCCFESWLLGNRVAVPRNPQPGTLKEYLDFYDVLVQDPELMPRRAGHTTRAQFHYKYFREVASCRRFTYSKRDPGEVVAASFVEQLRRRTTETGQMATLQEFFDLCDEIDERVEPAARGPRG